MTVVTPAVRPPETEVCHPTRPPTRRMPATTATVVTALIRWRLSARSHVGPDVVDEVGQAVGDEPLLRRARRSGSAVSHPGPRGRGVRRRAWSR